MQWPGKSICFCLMVSLFVLGGFGAAHAAPPTPITAEQAFDAYAAQTDPLTGAPAKVALVDVRSKAEYYWVGGAARVDTITLETGEEIVPDFGKTQLALEGTFLKVSVGGKKKMLNVKFIKSLTTSPISFLIPFSTWSEESGKLVPNPDFTSQVEALADEGFDVVIFFCRSGGRTDTCFDAELNPTLFRAVYEIDQPDGATNHGGFEGSSYSDIYNGYRGFPERETSLQKHQSVAWKDAGLPIHIGWTKDLGGSF